MSQIREHSKKQYLFLKIAQFSVEYKFRIPPGYPFNLPRASEHLFSILRKTDT